MLIVAGTFEVDAADQDAFVTARVAAMRDTRTEGGCLEYVMSADPVDATRVMLFERWEDQAALDAHMALIPTKPRAGGPAPKSFSVKIYDVAAERSFG